MPHHRDTKTLVCFNKRLCAIASLIKGLSLQPWGRRSMSVCCTDTLRATRGGQPMETDQYIGIDLHKAFFQACAMTRSGERMWEEKYPRTSEGIAAWRARCSRECAVAVEATTPTWSFVDQIIGDVGSVCIVDTRKTKLKAGYAAKTDRLDARRLADALRRESVVSIYFPPPPIRELRELCRHRLMLTQLRTRVLQRMRALLLRQGLGDPPARTTPQCRRSTMARRHRVAAASAGGARHHAACRAGNQRAPRARRSGGTP